jgi:hypothetical protein
VEEEGTSVAVEMWVRVETPVRVHRQHAAAALVNRTVAPLLLAPMPKHHVVARLMAPRIPKQRIVAAAMNRMAVANRTATPNTLAGSC